MNISRRKFVKYSVLSALLAAMPLKLARLFKFNADDTKEPKEISGLKRARFYEKID